MSISVDATHNLTLFGGILCPDTQSGLHFPHIHPEEVRFLTEECSHLLSRCHTCKTLNEELLSEVGGLALTSKKLLTPEDLENQYIPIVTDDFIRNEIADLPFEYLGVSLKALNFILKKYGHNLPPCLQNKKLVVFLSGTDKRLEEFVWVHQSSIIKHLSYLGVTAVVAPNFSVFYRWCPVGQQYNLKRSLYYAEKISDAGIPVIPHFYSQNQYHTGRILEYLNKHSEIKVISTNCQMQKKLFDRDVLYNETSRIVNLSGINQVILEGARVTDLKNNNQKFKTVVLANKLPFSYAQYGRGIEVSDNCSISRPSGLSVESVEDLSTLTLRNITCMEKFVGLCL